MAGFSEHMSLEDLPPSLRVYLKTEALRRGVEPGMLLEEILAGSNPLPQHISDLVREVWKRRGKGSAE
jgi:hypothetical protein